MSQFIIHGGKKLKGEISVNGSKNAAVAILMGSLINRGQTKLKNVPQIEEINRLAEVLESIGVGIRRQGRDVLIGPRKQDNKTTRKQIGGLNLDKIDKQAARKTRSIILAIGALSPQLKSFEIPQAGGCKLGSRTIKPHVFALEKFGIDIKTKSNKFIINTHKLRPAEVVLYETGDTVTENVLLAAAQIPGKTVIKMASANYMVQDLCYFLEKLGVKIKWTGAGVLEVIGLAMAKVSDGKNIEYEISEDPIEAMLFLSAAITTNSQLEIKRCPIDFLELELLKLEKMGLKYKLNRKYKSKNNKTNLVDMVIYPSKLKALAEKIHAMPFPGINQDNLPFFVPIATQVKGQTFIHDWTYENRAIYFSELNKLGANINLIDNHRVEITGPTELKGTEIACPPALRPAAIILVAMLGAKGKSILRDVYPIYRGYERLEERLGEIGAEIELTDS